MVGNCYINNHLRTWTISVIRFDHGTWKIGDKTGAERTRRRKKKSGEERGICRFFSLWRYQWSTDIDESGIRPDHGIRRRWERYVEEGEKEKKPSRRFLFAYASSYTASKLWPHRWLGTWKNFRWFSWSGKVWGTMSSPASGTLASRHPGFTSRRQWRRQVRMTVGLKEFSVSVLTWGLGKSEKKRKKGRGNLRWWGESVRGK